MDFILKKEQIKKLYRTHGNHGCMVSRRITVDGLPVGYMYREEQSNSFPDSGWRFFSGDETDEYTNCANNFDIMDLNTVCNYDQSIISFLNSPVGTAYYKEKGKFIKECLAKF